MSTPSKHSLQPVFLIPLRDIERAHIDLLLANRVRESRYLDYKSELYGWTDEGKIQLLKHVSGFANTGGGLLIFGVLEENEEPIDICGVTVGEEHIRKIRMLIHEGIQPTLSDVEVRALAHPRGHLLLLRVPMGFEPPYMVAYKNHHRFYRRFDADTLPMTVHEIRKAYERSSIDSMGQLKLRQPVAPFNHEFLIELHNTLQRDTGHAQTLVIDYIRRANAELNSRHSDLNAIAVSDEGELSTSPAAQRYAMCLAKSNTYLDRSLKAIDKAVDSLALLYSFVSETGELMEAEQSPTLSLLVQRKHEADKEYDELVDALERLVDTLRGGRPLSKSHRDL